MKLVWLSLLALIVVGVLASVVPAQVSRTQPRIISGGDLGFRVTGTDTQGRPVGSIVVRVNGEWFASTANGLRRASRWDQNASRPGSSGPRA